MRYQDFATGSGQYFDFFHYWHWYWMEYVYEDTIADIFGRYARSFW